MSRLDAISRAFLRYLYESSHFRPEVDGFFDSPHARVDDTPPTRAELVRVVTRLRAYELVATSGQTADGIPTRAGLTGAGLICAGNYGGDVDAWSKSTPGAVAVITEVEQDVEPAATVSKVKTSVPEQRRISDGIDVVGVIRVVRVLLLALPAVNVDSAEEDRIQEAATKVLEAARQPDPDSRRVRQLAQRLRMRLATGSLSGTLGIVLLDGLDEALSSGSARGNSSG